jgi:hypothetical protein
MMPIAGPFAAVCASRRHAHPSRMLWCRWACLSAYASAGTHPSAVSLGSWRPRPWSTLSALTLSHPRTRHGVLGLVLNSASVTTVVGRPLGHAPPVPVWAGAGDGGAHRKRQAPLFFRGIQALSG